MATKHSPKLCIKQVKNKTAALWHDWRTDTVHSSLEIKLERHAAAAGLPNPRFCRRSDIQTVRHNDALESIDVIERCQLQQ